MEIWSKTADLAVSVAGKVLSKELGESDHRRLVEVAMGELPANGRGRVAIMIRPRPPPTRPSNVFDDVAPELTRNYAEALLNATGDEAEAVVNELEELRADVLDAQPRFSAAPGLLVGLGFRERPILTSTFEGRAMPTVVRFLRVLNRHGRLGLLPRSSSKPARRSTAGSTASR